MPAGLASDAAPPEPFFDELPAGIRVATGSLRRQAQLLHRRPDVRVVEVRGNVETRIRKLDEGRFDALVLAEAGLRRLELERRIACLLEPPVLYPAVGQGALGIECRTDDDQCRFLLEQITDRATFAAVRAERALLAQLRAGCHAPVGAWSEVNGEELTVEAVVLSRDGRERLLARKAGTVNEPEELGRAIAADLIAQGAARLVAEPGGSEDSPMDGPGI
ncbi:MAG TPA: hydroxymethylbilane synthase [Planctomycetaceae bacterium]|nr:hydroxymethylbilane synthase [Planctomycetaceae bacterium]